MVRKNKIGDLVLQAGFKLCFFLAAFYSISILKMVSDIVMLKNHNFIY
jgi:hypothetical protein